MIYLINKHNPSTTVKEVGMLSFKELRTLLEERRGSLAPDSSSPRAVWGPTWAVITVAFPGGSPQYSFTVGRVSEEWDPSWGEEIDLLAASQWVAQLCTIGRQDFDAILKDCPFLLPTDSRHDVWKALRVGGA